MEDRHPVVLAHPHLVSRPANGAPRNDALSTGPMVMWGDYDPASRTFTLEGTVADPLSGNPAVPVRNTIQLLDDGTSNYENWGAAPDGTMFKSMEIHSTKR